MGWHQIPEYENSSADANPFAGPKLQSICKIAVNLPTDKWLCKKLEKLSLTLVEGYPSRSLDAGGLQSDQFMKTSRSQSKWYGLHMSTRTPKAILCPSSAMNQPSSPLLIAALRDHPACHLTRQPPGLSPKKPR